MNINMYIFIRIKTSAKCVHEILPKIIYGVITSPQHYTPFPHNFSFFSLKGFFIFSVLSILLFSSSLIFWYHSYVTRSSLKISIVMWNDCPIYHLTPTQGWGFSMEEFAKSCHIVSKFLLAVNWHLLSYIPPSTFLRFAVWITPLFAKAKRDIWKNASIGGSLVHFRIVAVTRNIF